MENREKTLFNWAGEDGYGQPSVRHRKKSDLSAAARCGRGLKRAERESWRLLKVDGVKSLEAAVSGFEFGEAAAFLLDEVVLGSANAFGGREDALPVGAAFAKQNRIAFRWVG